MRLLLAEDEKSLSNVLVAILKHNNYSVDAVYNGQDAIDYLDSDVYDCAILDIMMPKVDGLTVLKTIRDKGNKIPVLMLTAKNDINDKVKGLDLGADDYLTKPFITEELLARIRALLRRKDEVEDNSLFYEDIKLDRLSFELVAKNGKVALTAKEFQLIELLMKNYPVVISQEKIMEKIWGYESDSDINVVWTYISYLRKKLKNIGSKVIIKSVRNFGYSLGKIND